MLRRRIFFGKGLPAPASAIWGEVFSGTYRTMHHSRTPLLHLHDLDQIVHLHPKGGEKGRIFRACPRTRFTFRHPFPANIFKVSTLSLGSDVPLRPQRRETVHPPGADPDACWRATMEKPERTIPPRPP